MLSTLVERLNEIPRAGVWLTGAILLGAMFLLFHRLQENQLWRPLPELRITSEEEFHKIQQSLKARGLTAAKRNHSELLVPAEQIEAYQSALSSEDSSPRSTSRWVAAWQDSTQRLGQFSASRDRQTAEEMARVQVLTRLLKELPNVSDAEIVWDEDDRIGWNRQRRARAAVYLKSKNQRPIDLDVIDAVRRAVAASKRHLRIEDVVVMDQTAMMTYDGQDAALSDEMKQAAAYRRQIEQLLGYLDGVEVQVHIDPSTRWDENGEPAAPKSEDSPTDMAGRIHVNVSVPEATIAKLAKLDMAASRNSSAQRRREVFQAVEGHLHRRIRKKVATVLPAAMPKDTGAVIVVDTIPSPSVPSQPIQPTSLKRIAGMLRVEHLQIIAALSGLGALWLLLPGLRRDSSHGNAGGTAARSCSPPGFAPQSAASPLQASPEDPKEGAPAPFPVKGEKESFSARRSAPEPAERTGRDRIADALGRLQPFSMANDSPRAFEAPEINQDQDATPPASLQVSDREEPVLAFEELSRLESGSLREFSCQFEPSRWAAALSGTSPECQARILPKLDASISSEVKACLKASRPIRIREIDQAQQAILNAWSRMRRNRHAAALC